MALSSLQMPKKSSKGPANRHSLRFPAAAIWLGVEAEAEGQDSAPKRDTHVPTLHKGILSADGNSECFHSSWAGAFSTERLSSPARPGRTRNGNGSWFSDWFWGQAGPPCSVETDRSAAFSYANPPIELCWPCSLPVPTSGSLRESKLCSVMVLIQSMRS